MKPTNNKNWDRDVQKRNPTHFILQKVIAIFLFLSAACLVNADTPKTDVNDSKLIDEFVKAKGYAGIISFDASNIKQFWIEKDVFCKDDNINIVVKQINNAQKTESVPLKIQLSNVIETQDCKIDIISDSADVAFSVKNSKEKVISKSSNENDFIQYHVSSALVHLDDTPDFSFQFVFSSDKTDILKIKRIILSFSNNKESKYLGSSGYAALLKEIETKGVSLPDTDIKYFISEEFNKIFIKIPNKIAQSYKYFYHIVPTEAKDRVNEKTSFNNCDGIANGEYSKIPTPCFGENNYTIIQLALPQYPYKKIFIGQFESSKQIWEIKLP